MLEAVHGLQVAVKFVVGINNELRNGEVTEDIAQTAAQGDDRLSSRSEGVHFRDGEQLRIVEHIVTLGAQRSLNPIPESGRQNLAGTGGGREKNKIVQIEPQRLRFGENTALNLRGNNSVGACERRQIDMHILRPRLQEGLSLVIHREET